MNRCHKCTPQTIPALIHQREFCLFTSNFELVYMLLTAYAINFLVAATGYTSLAPTGRKKLIQFAIIDSILYSVYMLIGAIIPVKFLVSYEGFMAFIGVNFIIMFILNIRHYQKFRDALNRNLIMVWIGFLLVNIGFFVFLFGGFGAQLYQSQGIWFNENDVLHILLILWTVMLFLLLRTRLMDTAER
jgi:purine-cytosine permease-like protein